MLIKSERNGVPYFWNSMINPMLLIRLMFVENSNKSSLEQSASEFSF